MPDVSVVYELPQIENNAELSGVSPDEKISPNSTIEHNFSIIEGFGEKFSKRYYIIKYEDDTRISAKNGDTKGRSDFRSKDVPKLRSVCQLFREFEAGSKRLSHDELFGLATNLTNVETGEKLFLKIFRANAYADERIGKYDYWVHQMKKYISGYKPQSCNNFHCRYCDSCPHGTNMLSTAKLKYHQMERIAGYTEPLYTLDEAEKDFNETFKNAMNDVRKLWFIIKAQTAIGKTESYLRLIASTSMRVLIVVPTIQLKHEVKIRAAKMGIEIIESPSLHEIQDELPDDVWSHIEYLYASGKSVIPYLKKVICESHPECAKLIRKYLRWCRQ